MERGGQRCVLLNALASRRFCDKYDSEKREMKPAEKRADAGIIPERKGAGPPSKHTRRGAYTIAILCVSLGRARAQRITTHLDGGTEPRNGQDPAC